jgi:maleylacetate reductase
MAAGEDEIATVAEALVRLGSRRVLIITGPSGRHLEHLRPTLAGFDVTSFSGARRHMPEAVVAEARARLDQSGADTVLTLGGGATTGIGKILRRERGIRFVAIPTTYSGSELTTSWSLRLDATNQRTGGRDPRVRPDAILRLVELTVTLPLALTTTSLLNALAHALSALETGASADPRALTAIETIQGALTTLARSSDDRAGRVAAQRGAALAAMALEDQGGRLGRHHALVHRLGASLDLDHAGLHSVLLPHSIRRLRDTHRALLVVLEQRLGIGLPLESQVFQRLRESGAPTSLSALGLPSAQLERALAEQRSLPRDLLMAAFAGVAPT